MAIDFPSQTSSPENELNKAERQALARMKSWCDRNPLAKAIISRGLVIDTTADVAQRIAEHFKGIDVKPVLDVIATFATKNAKGTQQLQFMYVNDGVIPKIESANFQTVIKVLSDDSSVMDSFTRQEMVLKQRGGASGGDPNDLWKLVRMGRAKFFVIAVTGLDIADDKAANLNNVANIAPVSMPMQTAFIAPMGGGVSAPAVIAAVATAATIAATAAIAAPAPMAAAPAVAPVSTPYIAPVQPAPVTVSIAVEAPHTPSVTYQAQQPAAPAPTPAIVEAPAQPVAPKIEQPQAQQSQTPNVADAAVIAPQKTAVAVFNNAQSLPQQTAPGIEAPAVTLPVLAQKLETLARTYNIPTLHDAVAHVTKALAEPATQSVVLQNVADNLQAMTMTKHFPADAKPAVAAVIADVEGMAAQTRLPDLKIQPSEGEGLIVGPVKRYDNDNHSPIVEQDIRTTPTPRKDPWGWDTANSGSDGIKTTAWSTGAQVDHLSPSKTGGDYFSIGNNQTNKANPAKGGKCNGCSGAFCSACAGGGGSQSLIQNLSANVFSDLHRAPANTLS